MSDVQKMEAFGRMVFDMMSSVLLLPDGPAYARRTVTMPDGHGGKHELALIVARSHAADVMEGLVAAKFDITDIKAETGVKQ